MSNLLALAKRAALKAGRAIIKEYEAFDPSNIMIKSDSSPVTSADLASNDIIFNILKDSGIPICSEENILNFENRIKNSSFWIVDPLDGTKEFIAKNGEFCVCIALMQELRITLGVIFIPLTGELFYASESGVFKEKLAGDNFDKTIKKIDLIKNKTYDPKLYIGRRGKASFAYELAKKIDLNIKRIGSAIKFTTLVEYGGVYLRLSPSHEWDNAAGVALVKFSGGSVLELQNYRPISFGSKSLKSPNFLALDSNFAKKIDSILPYFNFKGK